MAKSKLELAAEADSILEESIENVRKVFNDDEAPATSRASAVSSALRIYEILKGDDPGDKAPSEMTYEELQASIGRLERQRQAGETGSDEPPAQRSKMFD
jgi:hypothetical protein